MKLNYLIILSFLFLFSSCEKENKDRPSTENSRTVLIYMAADNSLNQESYENMEGIIENALNNLGDGKLLIYYDRYRSNPKLVEVYQNRNKIETKVIKEYSEHNSASGEILSDVINDAFSIYKSKSQGLILWSHATSWLPADQSLWTRSFGKDGLDEMDIAELKQALPDSFFDFIIFDACLMASVEVCYELKDKAKYIIASPNEIFAKGFPYDEIVEDMYSNESLENQLKTICDKFYDYYLSSSASISMINTSKLNELADLSKKILADERDIRDMDVSNVQTIYYTSRRKEILYDFKDYLEQFTDKEEQAELDKLLQDIIFHQRNTDKIYVSDMGLIELKKNSGLSSYIPRRDRADLNRWYLGLDWARAVYDEAQLLN